MLDDQLRVELRSLLNALAPEGQFTVRPHGADAVAVGYYKDHIPAEATHERMKEIVQERLPGMDVLFFPWGSRRVEERKTTAVLDALAKMENGVSAEQLSEVLRTLGSLRLVSSDDRLLFRAVADELSQSSSD